MKKSSSFSADLAENGGALAFADILLPLAAPAGSTNDKTAWQMIEVKSSTSVKDYYRDDAAIQFHVARGAGVNLASMAVAVIDNQWVYQGDGDYRGLLKTEDVTDASLAKDAEVREWIAQAQAIVKLPVTPERDTGEHCTKPFPCGFIDHCSAADGTAADDVAHPIQCLSNAQSKALKASLLDKAAAPRSMLEVPEEHLSAIQRRVKQAHKTDKPFIDAAGLSRALTPHQPFKGKSAYFPSWKYCRTFFPQKTVIDRYR